MMRHLTPGSRRARGGNVAFMTALMMLPLSLLAALGIDFGRAYVAQAQLSQAVDAGALAGARVLGSRDPTEDVQMYLDANLLPAAMDVTSIVITPSDDFNTLTVSARAELRTTFMRLAGSEWETLPVGASATARRTTQGMELALVLDTTGSMFSGGRIGALRVAAADLITILFGEKTTADNLYIAIVPYAATLNIGHDKESWLVGGAVDDAAYAPFRWRGCVEARGGGEDQTDTPPSESPLTPFLYASTRLQTAASAWGITSNKEPILGDADWGTTPALSLKFETLDPDDSDSLDPKVTRSDNNRIKGPNVGCPQPIAGLTNDRDKLLEIVGSLQAFNRGGTMANIGLQAGWWTLSPRWRNLWGTSLWGTSTPAGLPLDYPDEDSLMTKVIVMMTDGNNEWYNHNINHSGHADGQPSADYTAYGRLSEGRLGTTSSSGATTAINSRMLTMCTRIKDAGIIVYTITLGGVSAATRDLYLQCASGPGFYFNSPTAADLGTSFREIGAQLANLRLEK